KARSYRIANADHHDWDYRSGLLGCAGRRRAVCRDDVHWQRSKFTRCLPQSIHVRVRRSVFDDDVLTDYIAEIIEPLAKVIPPRAILDDADSRDRPGGCRVRTKRPCAGRAAE